MNEFDQEVNKWCDQQMAAHGIVCVPDIVDPIVTEDDSYLEKIRDLCETHGYSRDAISGTDGLLPPKYRNYGLEFGLYPILTPESVATFTEYVAEVRYVSRDITHKGYGEFIKKCIHSDISTTDLWCYTHWMS